MSRKKFFALLLIGLVVLLPFIHLLKSSSTASGIMAPCIFCDILAGKHPETKIEVETLEFVIFKDIKKVSEHHYLAVSKRHIESLKTLTKGDDCMVGRMEDALKELFTSKGIDTNDALFGFHYPPFISVPHLHMHGIAPRSGMSFVDRMTYRPGTAWFKSVDEARAYIKNNH